MLSDHGQSTGATFKQRYGLSLGDLVDRLISKGGRRETSVRETGGDEGWGHRNALLTEIVRAEGVTGRGRAAAAARRGERPPGPGGDAGDGAEARGRGRGAVRCLGPEAAERRRAAADVVVCPSGNLANVYFTKEPGRLSLESLVAAYPGLVEGLTAHPGIGFVVVYSEARGHVALGARGARDLDSGRVLGADPLATFSPHLGAQLRRVSGYDNVGDLLLNTSMTPRPGRSPPSRS